ncbi:MAG: hypothetical protein GX862_05775 [Leucobacter sp.]|jgi:hypothetical protein|nr:hypothetical protein [Leucobacter sp.]
MAKQNEALFEESSQGSVSAITAVFFVLSTVLVLGGMVLFSYGFGTGESDIWLFSAGLAATIIGFILPFAVLPKIGK